MALKRIFPVNKNLKESKKFKKKNFSFLSQKEKDELLELIAKKLNMVE